MNTMRANPEKYSLIKTIRSDDHDFWPQLVLELVWREEREFRFEKRVQERKNYVIRLNTVPSGNIYTGPFQYEIVPTNANLLEIHVPRLSPEQKTQITKHQSTTLVVISKDKTERYLAPPFGHSRANTSVLVGITIATKDAVPWLMSVYDGGTVNRPNDGEKEALEKRLREKLADQSFHTSYESLAKHARTLGREKHNEVLAGLSWNLDGSSQLTIFTDTLESRLLAQLRAADLKKRLAEKYPGREIFIPITLYPSYKEYKQDKQEKDFQTAKKYPNLLNYCHAIELVRNNKKPMVSDKQALFNFILEKVGLQYAIDAISSDNPLVPARFVHLNDFIIRAWFKNTVAIQKNILCGFLYDLEKINKAQRSAILCHFFPVVLTAESESVKNILYSFIINLTEKISTEDFTALIQQSVEKGELDQNALYWIMYGLSYTGERNPTKLNLLKNSFIQLIEKTTVDHFTLLINALTEKDKSQQNVLYWMMYALNRAAVLKNSAQVDCIANFFIRLIEKTPVNNFTKLINAMAEKDKSNINVFYWMTNALFFCTVLKNPAQIGFIANCFIRLIKKTPIHNFTTFIQAVSQKNQSGENALYWMMRALFQADKKNPENANLMTDFFIQLIEKTPADHFTTFLQGLAEKNSRGINAFFWMMHCLLPPENIEQISFGINCLYQLIKKTKGSNTFLTLVQMLLKTYRTTVFFPIFISEVFSKRALSDDDKILFYNLIIQFTHFFKIKKPGLFLSKATWPDGFQYAEKIKEIYHNMFDYFTQKKSDQVDPGFLKIFLETARSREYLIDYCDAKIKTDPAFYEQHILNADSAIAKLLNRNAQQASFNDDHIVMSIK